MMGKPRGGLRTKAIAGTQVCSKNENGDDTFEPEGDFRRWLESFCDASAIAAFKKYHYHLMALVEDHLTLNQRITEWERAKARSFMERVTRQIALAEMDADSSIKADQLLAGLRNAGHIDRGVESTNNSMSIAHLQDNAAEERTSFEAGSAEEPIPTK